jgi:hypothetical protein
VTSFNDFIKDNATQLTEEIKNKCLTTGLLESERARIATKLISAITEMVVFSILKKLSSSFSSKALYTSFNKLTEAERDIPAYKLINAMIGLDNSSSFPKNAIEEAYHESNNITLARGCCRSSSGHIS